LHSVKLTVLVKEYCIAQQKTEWASGRPIQTHITAPVMSGI